MSYYVKDRGPNSLVNGFWGTYKPEYFGYSSLEAMTESEAEIMTLARKLYSYIPKVIEHNYERQQLIVEKIEGEHINDYIKRTHDLTIIDKFKDAIRQLRFQEITLIHRYPDHYKQGYIVYHDYHPNNFIVDNYKNIWFIDWDISGLYPENRLQEDDEAVSEFCDELQMFIMK